MLVYMRTLMFYFKTYGADTLVLAKSPLEEEA